MKTNQNYVKRLRNSLSRHLDEFKESDDFFESSSITVEGHNSRLLGVRTESPFLRLIPEGNGRVGEYIQLSSQSNLSNGLP